jgi:hypothetical protein
MISIVDSILGEKMSQVKPTAVVFSDGTVRSFLDWIQSFESVESVESVESFESARPIEPEPRGRPGLLPQVLSVNTKNLQNKRKTPVKIGASDRTGNRCRVHDREYTSVLEASRGENLHRYWITKYCNEGRNGWQWI